MKLSLTLPMPPSVNHYYGHCYNHGTKQVQMYIKPEGKTYREKVYYMTANKISKLHNPLQTAPILFVMIKYNPKSALRDIDNPLKCLLDALTHSHIWSDDRQVKMCFLEQSLKTSVKNDLNITITDTFDDFKEDIIRRLEAGLIQQKVI